jgi:hypothetical protein
MPFPRLYITLKDQKTERPAMIFSVSSEATLNSIIFPLLLVGCFKNWNAYWKNGMLAPVAISSF